MLISQGLIFLCKEFKIIIILKINIMNSENNTSHTIVPDSPSKIYVYSDKECEENYDVIFNKIDDELELVLPDDFNQTLTEKSFVTDVCSLVFGRFFNQTIKKNTLPKNLKYLVFGDNYDKMLETDVLPQTLISLTFGKNYNIELTPNVLPNSLLYLKLGEKYNKELGENVLPKSLIVLEFDKYSCFNKNIKKYVLPDSIKKIIFGDTYNQELKENRLPSNLKYLDLGKRYDYFLKPNVLPTSLKYIEIGFYYVSPLQNLPNSVEVVCFDRFDGLDWNLPATVKKIIIKNYVSRTTILTIPNTINQVQLINYKMIKDFNIEIPANCALINKWGDKINI